MSYYLRVAAGNLGNILSTESISPAALYPMRKSGYKSFESLDLEGADKSEIRLHKKAPSFTRSDSDCPIMLIMVPDDAVFSPREKNGFTWTTETIYIEPRKGFSFIFENQEELDSAFNAIAKNSEAKFATEYRKFAITASRTKNQLVFETINEQDGLSNENDLMEANRFETLDRLKGAIYCYQLDKALSIPGDQINRELSRECMKATDELINTVTQRDDSKTGESEKKLAATLYALALRNEARKYERALKEGGTEALPDCDDSWQSINKDFSIDIPSNVINSQSELEIFRAGIERRIREISHREFKTTSKGKMSIEVNEGAPTIALPSSPFGELAEHLVNWLAVNDVYHKEDNSIGYSFVRKCGTEIKQFLGEDKWTEKNTEEKGARSCQDYVNGLLQRLNKSQPFDFDTSLGVDQKTFEAIRALALLCAKDSNKDLESFYRYLLLKHGVTDFRLPFAIWGAVFGFSQIPKMLCDQLDAVSAKEARRLFRRVVEIERAEKETEHANSVDEPSTNDAASVEIADPPTEKALKKLNQVRGNDKEEDIDAVEVAGQENNPKNEEAPAIVEEDAEASA